MKKSVRAVIALFLVIFSLAGIITASASTPNGAIADLEAEGTTVTGVYTSATTEPFSDEPTTTRVVIDAQTAKGFLQNVILAIELWMEDENIDDPELESALANFKDCLELAPHSVSKKVLLDALDDVGNALKPYGMNIVGVYRLKDYVKIMYAEETTTPETTSYEDYSTTTHIYYPSSTVPCSGETTTAVNSEELIDLTVKEILNMIVDIAKNESAQWDDIEGAVIRIVDIVENMGNGTVSKGELDEAVADLEAVLEDEDIEGMDELLEQLKEKIKGMYAGEVATTAPSTTYPIATGTDSDAPTTIKPTRVDTDIPATGHEDDCTTIWDIIGDLFEKIEGFFRSILEILC